MKRRANLFLLTAVFLLPLFTVGCGEHRRGTYDPYNHDYHRWNNGEDGSYRRWLAEKRWDYRQYNRLQRQQREEYWQWRHNHRD
jgi:hypothetical protein